MKFGASTLPLGRVQARSEDDAAKTIRAFMDRTVFFFGGGYTILHAVIIRNTPKKSSIGNYVGP